MPRTSEKIIMPELSGHISEHVNVVNVFNDVNSKLNLIHGDHGNLYIHRPYIHRPCRRAHDFKNWRQDIKFLQMVKMFIVYRRVFR